MVKRLGYLFFVLLAVAGIAYGQSQLVAFLDTETVGVELRRTETEIWVPVDVQSVIGVGDAIRTDGEGTATVNFFDGASVTLLPQTTIRIDRLEDGPDGYAIGYTVFEGHTEQTLTSPSDKPASFEVKSPKMTLLTRGGQFNMWLGEGDTTQVITLAGEVFTSGGGELIEIPPNNGTRVDAEGVLSEIVPAETVETLTVALDGIPGKFRFDGDVVLNVRQGPSRQSNILGTVAPDDVEIIKGISQDGVWYRIPFEDGSGWISSQSMNVSTDETHMASFPGDFLEDLDGGGRLVVSAEPEAAASQSVEVIPGAALLEQYSMEELEVIARINEFRRNKNLLPVKLNPTLSQMAADQGGFLSGIPESSWPNDVHQDAQGRGPRQRALDPAYRWPHYGIESRMAVGEILYTGATPQSAVTWWDGSPIHNETMSNPGYREVGIATYPHPYGNMFVVVFGSRPNIFPALINPNTDEVLIATENYRYAEGGGDWITSIQDVQMIPTTISELELAVLTELDDEAWTPWEPALEPPIAEAFAVALRQGDKRVISTINPLMDIALYLDTIPTPAAESEDGTVFGMLPPPADFDPVITPDEETGTQLNAISVGFITHTLRP